jgi:hypothetical protein
MLTKAVPRAIACSARFFHSSASVSRVVAANPIKAEEVKVLVISCSLTMDLNFYFFSRGLPVDIPSSSMNSMLSSCKHASPSIVGSVSFFPLKRCWWCWPPRCLWSCRGRVQDGLHNQTFPYQKPYRSCSGWHKCCSWGLYTVYCTSL